MSNPKVQKHPPKSPLPEIEKNIPIPEKTRNKKYPLAEMGVGDSFWVQELPRKVSKAAFNYAKGHNLDWKFKCLAEDDGARCWRIK